MNYAPPKYIPEEKRPRQYAAEIRVLPERERAAALERVPSHLREWVRGYLNHPLAQARQQQKPL